MKTSSWRAAALAAVLTASGTAVAAPGSAAPAAALPAFGSCGELVERMRELALDRVSPYGFGYRHDRSKGGGWTRPGPQRPADRSKAGVAASRTVPASAKVTSTSGGSAVGPGATGTNLQEPGVDEPDVAKTDGSTVVSLDGNSLRVFEVAGDAPRARGALRFAALEPAELLLAGDRVLVIGTRKDPGREQRWHRLALSLVDISDRNAPKVLSTQILTGRHVSTRMVGGVARVVLTSDPYLVFRAPGWREGAEARALEKNRAVIRTAPAEAWLPSRRAVAADGTAGPARPLVNCSDVRYPAEDSGLGLLTVLTVDLADPASLAAGDPASLVAGGQFVYAGTERLYVATSRHRGFAPERHTRRTALHAFDINRPGGARYAGSGVVDGFLLDRWALSEHEGDLRVVTTRSGAKNRWRFSSAVVVLRPRDGRLEPVGRAGGMGLGELVYAVRWFADMAAVVTYRQIDPLYLVDLSEPEAPRVRGALKVPGFSQYLHPTGDGRLFGVGQGGDNRGHWGLQVSAFDISDPDHPRRSGNLQYGISRSSSIVQRDARHFLYLPDLHTAFLPADIPGEWKCADDMTCVRDPHFKGLLAVRVDADGTIAPAASWNAHGAPKALPLPGNRLAALDDKGLTVLDAAGLAVRGFAAYPKAAEAP